jgi:type IV secretion system protein VirB10
MIRNSLLAVSLSLALGGAAAAQPPPTPPAQNPPEQQKQETTAAPAQAAPVQEAPAEKPRAKRLLVPSGTKLPLVLHNSVSTRTNKAGDTIYLETTFPIIVEGRIAIPAGSYISGEILFAKRPGKVAGRGEMQIKMNTMILPNGYTVDFNAIPTGAGTGANDTVEEEGRIKGDTDKGGDAGTVLKTTSAGAGIGGIAARSGRGAGIGAGVGAAVGLMTILLSRGPELDLPRGTTLDVELNRPLYLDSEQINFTDPGRASSLAGPPNRQPQRQRIPF